MLVERHFGRPTNGALSFVPRGRAVQNSFSLAANRVRQGRLARWADIKCSVSCYTCNRRENVSLTPGRRKPADLFACSQASGKNGNAADVGAVEVVSQNPAGRKILAGIDRDWRRQASISDSTQSNTRPLGPASKRLRAVMGPAASSPQGCTATKRRGFLDDLFDLAGLSYSPRLPGRWIQIRRSSSALGQRTAMTDGLPDQPARNHKSKPDGPEHDFPTLHSVWP